MALSSSSRQSSPDSWGELRLARRTGPLLSYPCLPASLLLNLLGRRPVVGARLVLLVYLFHWRYKRLSWHSVQNQGVKECTQVRLVQ